MSEHVKACHDGRDILADAARRLDSLAAALYAVGMRELGDKLDRAVQDIEAGSAMMANAYSDLLTESCAASDRNMYATAGLAIKLALDGKVSS